MANDDIDLDRVLIDPSYRREVIDYLNARARRASADGRPPLPGDAAVSRAGAGPQP